MTLPAVRFELDRDGQLPIAFTGHLVATSTYDGGARGWSRTDIYKTITGKIVVHVTQGRDGSERSAAFASADPESVLDWLRTDGRNGKIGLSALEAWDDACAKLPELEKYRYEDV